MICTPESPDSLDLNKNKRVTFNCILVDGADRRDEFTDGDEGEDSGDLDKDGNGGKWWSEMRLVDAMLITRLVAQFWIFTLANPTDVRRCSLLDDNNNNNNTTASDCLLNHSPSLF